MKSYSPSEIAFLSALIHITHGQCTHLRTVHIEQIHHGRTLWTGPVAIFQLHDHPTAPECFAWLSDELQETTTPAIYLKSDSIDSPAAAIHAYVLELSRTLAA